MLEERTKALMILGTASNVGKSTIALGLLRVLRRRGLAAAPFKALNITDQIFLAGDGYMSRGQAAQCEAAGIEPTCLANPVALTLGPSPMLYARGERIELGSDSSGYYAQKGTLRQAAFTAYAQYAAAHPRIVLEGAGSPVELNLMEGDYVNCAMARQADADILLVGDISKGGVFASLYGTLELMPEQERERVRGLIVNQFAGDLSSFADGARILQQKCGVPVLGVIPRGDFDLEMEDSLSDAASENTRDRAYREAQYDALADWLERYLDIGAILEMMEGGA